MAHRAGTGDAPIPGLVTSRRNPAYKLKQQEARRAAMQQGQPKQDFARGPPGGQSSSAAKGQRRKSRSPSREPRAWEVQKEEDDARRAREQKEEEDKKQRDRQDEEKRKRKAQDDEVQKQKVAEMEKAWAEERKAREDQRKLEVQRQQDRKNKLKGAFAMEDDEEKEEDLAAKQLAEMKKKATSGGGLPLPASASSTSTLRDGGRDTSNLSMDGSREDAIRLRASLADPSSARSHNPGDVAEAFKRLSEMKRRFRRAEFGGPDKRAREPSRSRSRSRDKYNSVWIRSKK